MLAYVFWHRPREDTEASHYEGTLRRFQTHLMQQGSPGLIGATTYKIEPTPWLSGRAGYEDWYWLAGSWALDPLNAFAVARPMQADHDGVASHMEEGAGGLYAHAGGEAPTGTHSTVYWLTRPRGVQWRPILEEIRRQLPQANLWRRQMVLGPAGEFAVETADDTPIDVPPGWQARRIARERL